MKSGSRKPDITCKKSPPIINKITTKTTNETILAMTGLLSAL